MLRFRPSPLHLFALFLIPFNLILFRVVFPVEETLQSADFNFGLISFYKHELPTSALSGFWRSFPLLGRVGHMPLTFHSLLLSLLPAQLFMDWIYAIDLSVAALFLFAFLQRRGLGPWSSAFGSLCAFYLGSNLTLILPGHLEKYGVLLFASASLYCLQAYLDKPSPRRALLAGGSASFMFLHQADLALFFALFLGAFFLYELLARKQKQDWVWIPLMLLPALLILQESFRENMNTQVRNVSILQEGTAEEQWNFATQWSWPPAESLDLIAPGYWGWRSGHPEAPYHGEMGQTADFPKTGQGLPNLKSESQYLGLLPLLLSLSSLLACLLWRKDSNRLSAFKVWPLRYPPELFFALACLLSFLLACGDYSPLYGWFYRLPLVSSIRNPNKFLQVFQLCVGISAAHGLSLLEQERSPWLKQALPVLCLLSGFLLLGSSFFIQGEPLRQGIWASAADSILETRRNALFHAGLISLFCAAAFAMRLHARSKRFALPSLLLLLSLDAFLLGRHYLLPENIHYIRENPLADFLEERIGPNRVQVLDQSGIYNLMLTRLFPARNIAFANIAVAPRLQQEYQQYFQEMRNAPLQQWRDFASAYLLAPRSLWNQLQRNPGITQVLQEVYSYDVAMNAEEALQFQSRPLFQGGQVVLEFNALQPRFSLPQGAGKVEEVYKQGSSWLLKVQVTAPKATLRLSDLYDSRIRYSLNGEEAQIPDREGLLFASIPLKQGQHELELGFRGNTPRRFLQHLGILLTILACIPWKGLQLVGKRGNSSEV